MPALMRALEGRRILVTGAAGTFGGELVAEAVRQGAKVAASGREASIRRARFPDDVVVLSADLVDPGACRQLPGRANSALGGLDVLINNAARMVHRPFVELEQDDFDVSWAINARAPALLIQAAMPFLEQADSPAVVNVVSSAGLHGGLAPIAPYAMTKAALIALTKGLARELGPRGIRINSFAPGPMRSPMLGTLEDQFQQEVLQMNVFGRRLELVEVARAALFLAGDDASSVTGATLNASAVVL